MATQSHAYRVSYHSPCDDRKSFLVVVYREYAPCGKRVPKFHSNPSPSSRRRLRKALENKPLAITLHDTGFSYWGGLRYD